LVADVNGVKPGACAGAISAIDAERSSGCRSGSSDWIGFARLNQELMGECGLRIGFTQRRGDADRVAISDQHPDPE
jgi:hypothetical protein